LKRHLLALPIIDYDKNMSVNAAKQSDRSWMQESGPLRPLLMDDSISEIMVNKHDQIFIERAGVIQESPVRFDSVDSLIRFVQSIAVYTGKDLNRRNPYVDATLPDGSRINIVTLPVAVDGPSMTIRKFGAKSITFEQLLKNNSANEKIIYFLHQAVISRQNIVVSGGTGSGKTTLLNVIGSFIPDGERLVTIEDTAELRLPVKNLVRLESTDAVGNELGISIQDLLTNALRMRPDRIIIGECRGPEAWDMLLAMNTGHEGCMTSLHANSAFDALRRLEAMILRAGMEVPLSMIRSDIAGTINLIVQAERSSDGVRRIVEIAEVCGREQDSYVVNNIFTWDLQSGFTSTGYVPSFVQNNKNPDVSFHANFFNPAFKMSFSK
jgi:pilus assembly protein CpaF